MNQGRGFRRPGHHCPSASHRRLALRHASLRPGEPLPRRPRPAPPFSKLGRGAGIPSSGRDSYVELHPRRVTKLNAFSVCAHHVFRLVRETHTPPFRENPAQSSYDSRSVSRFSLMCTYFCILFRCFFPFLKTNLPREYPYATDKHASPHRPPLLTLHTSDTPDG